MSLNLLLGLLILACLAVWQFWPALSALWSKTWTSRSTGKVDETQQTMAEFAALDVVNQRFERNENEEGRAAVQQALNVFYRKPRAVRNEVQS